MKRAFQYSVYPFVIFFSSLLIISGIEAGYNQYVVTLPVLLMVGAVILMLEERMPYQQDWVTDKQDWNLDLTYYIINYCIKLTAQFVFIYLAAGLQLLAWFPVQLPFWIQVLLALAIIDFFLFLVHWQSHKYLFLWRLHAIHHSSERLYFLNGEKRHALHQILEGGPGILICIFIGTPQPVVVAALAILAINMFMQHTNLDYKAGILKKVFCVAELHRWHHRADYKEAQVNYGAWLTLWDHLFRTAYDKPHMKAELGAIGIAEEKYFPRSYWKQFLYPFSKKIRQQAKTGLMISGFSLFSFAAQAQVTGEELTGNWQLQDGSMRIQVYKEPGKYNGKIYRVRSTALQSDIGKKVLWNLTFDVNENEWNGGKLQLPGMKHEADCYIRLTSRDLASVMGYHGVRLFGKTKTLTRVK